MNRKWIGQMKGKEKYIIKTGVILFILAFLLISAYFAMHSRKFAAIPEEGGRIIGTCYMTMNNPFYEIVNEEVEARVERNGDRLINLDPALDSDKQSDQIYDLIAHKVSAIVVTPVDYEKVVPALKAAKEAGIYVLVVDSGIADTTVADSVITSDNYGAGVIAAEYLMQQKQTAKIVLMEHSVAESGRERIKGFEDTIAGHNEYQIVARGDSKGQLELAMPAMHNIIEEKVSFDTVFALNDPAAMGAMASLEEYGKLQGVDVIGIDGAPEAKTMIHEGMMMATVAQFPSLLGRKTGEVLYQLINGEKPEHTIYLPVELVDAENVEEYGTDRWQ